MSQQTLDLRKALLIIRRHRILVGIVAALGLLLGAAYSQVKPPPVSSTAIVVLPSSVPNIATQVLIADSDPVLSAALAKVSPRVSLDKLRTDVQVKSLTSNLISFTAKGKTAASANSAANAVAESYIAYVAPKKSPAGHVVATVLQSATPASSSPLKALLITALIGALAGAIVGAVVSLAIGRRDRKLRERDQIAKSIGIPVLASVPVGHPSDAEGWLKLLAEYRPRAVHGWQLRTAMDQLGIAGHNPVQHPHNGDGLVRDRTGGRVSLAVVSLSSDPGALALGPQLAAFAASQGIPTALVVGPQQDTNVPATLRAACAVQPSDAWPRYLRILAADDEAVVARLGAALVVVVVVIDAGAPMMPATMRTEATVIGVSAGKATAEQLARTAVAVAAGGRQVAGILVADPDPADETTGRVPHLVPAARHRLPGRLRGVVTETRT